MICPKCGNEMIIGALAQPGGKGSLFWANENYFNSKICNFFTAGNAVKEGGISIPLGNGVTSNRTKAWACKECKLVLIDCSN